MPVYTGRVKSLSVTVHGGAALTLTGIKKVTYVTNHNVEKDWDPQSTTPDHWRGNKDKSITLTGRDRALALALQDTACITALTCVLANPRRACEAETLTDGITITGSNLALVSEVPIDAGETDVPGDYDLTFEVSKVGGVAGSLEAVAAEPEE